MQEDLQIDFEAPLHGDHNHSAESNTTVDGIVSDSPRHWANNPDVRCRPIHWHKDPNNCS